MVQALYSGLADEKELQMLCADVSSALVLGEARIKVNSTPGHRLVTMPFYY